MPKDTQLLNREKWLEEISSWEIQGVQGISDLNFTEQEVNEIYAPIIQRLLSGHKRSSKARTGTLQLRSSQPITFSFLIRNYKRTKFSIAKVSLRVLTMQLLLNSYQKLARESLIQ